MQKILFFLILATGISVPSFCQEFSHEFGQISKDELQLKRYEKDTSAEAVVIYDIGQTSFAQVENTFDLIFERRTKIKIFTKAGMKWANIYIPYYEADNGKIAEIKGNTYNLENGEIKTIPLTNVNSFTELESKNRANKRIAMPEVKEGSVIELSYIIRMPYKFNLNSWEFQQYIPVIYSEYTVKMVPFYEYVSILKGTNKVDEYKSYEEKAAPNRLYTNTHDMVYFYAMNNIPAFKDESYITSVNDCKIRLDFQLAVIHYDYKPPSEIMSTWPKLCQDMLDEEKFGEYLNDCRKAGKKIIDDLKLVDKPKIDKAKIIFNYVKNNYNWSNNYGIYPIKNCKEFLLDKTGNCTNINLFLTGLLNDADIEAYPVLLSTRDHGKITIKYPFLDYFNYTSVFAKIDSSMVILDATEPFTTFNQIPTRCLNDYGLLMKKSKEDTWLQIRSNLISVKKYEFNLQPTAGKDSIFNVCKFTTTGYEATIYRKKYTTSYENLKKELISNNSETDDTLKSSRLNSYEQPFEIRFKEKVRLETIDNKLIVTPFCNKTISSNPLKMKNRTYPVDMTYKQASEYKSIIRIPEGYKLFSVPADTAINNKLITINYKVYAPNNGVVMIVGNYEFKKDVYEVPEYTDLKSSFNIIVNKFNEKLVLEKE